MERMTGLLLLLWAGATVSSVVDLQKRIIGGQDCDKKDRLYHVKLVDVNNDFLCGGSLIHPSWVLTAAHCNIPVLKAVVGVHPGPGTTLDISDHEPFKVKDISGKEWIHDIMLLKLTSPVTGITPVPLPDCKNRPKLKETVQRAGYGDKTKRPGDVKICGESTTLQCADNEIVDCAPYMACYKASNQPPYADPVDQGFVCAKRAGVDTCPGDSGGGVVYKGMIYGVHVESGKVACARATAHVDVCEHKDWIEKLTGLKFPV